MSLFPDSLFSRQRHFWRHLMRRDSPATGVITLTRQRVYIVPSPHGLLFALLLIAMLIGAINYQNSLAFIFTFLLSGLGLVSMVHTYRNLAGLSLRSAHAAPVFVGELVHFPVSVENHQGIPRFAVTLSFSQQQAVTADLPANSITRLTLQHLSSQRGWLSPGRITIYTRFPLGLFHAWAYLHFDLQALVYPSPSNAKRLPQMFEVDSSRLGDRGRGDADFSTLRNYHPGDSLRHIHWKALAREQGLLTKQFGGGVHQELLLKWELLGNMPTEERLSVLARWVLDADAKGISYGLDIPGHSVAPRSGALHRHNCLQALALFNR